MSKPKPCITYDEKFDPAELTQVKLELGGSSRKVPVFKASTGVEGLFHVIDKFMKAGTRLNFQAADWWDQFEDVLDAVAENKWTNLIQGIPNGQKTRNRFVRETTENFVAQYTESDQARDILVEYIKGDECKKRRKVDPGIHASRIETLCRYANRLAGTVPQLTDAQIKKLVFESFPGAWQDDYRKSHRDINDDSITDIVGYMTLCKAISDKEDEKRGKKRKAETERIRGGNTPSSSKKERKGKVEDKDECPVHGGHKWGACSLNPRSENWRGSGNGGRFGRGMGGRFHSYRGGRGSSPGTFTSHGRGSFGGRGNGNGRFQSGRGNGSGGRGGYHARGEQNYHYGHKKEEQSRDRYGWTQPDHYHFGPGRGDWHSGSGSHSRESSSSYGPHYTSEW